MISCEKGGVGHFPARDYAALGVSMGGFWHAVKQGEWVAKIAANYHIADWRATIWEHPENRELAERRNPNVLHPTDHIFIPVIKPKEVACDSDQTHVFVVHTAYDQFLLQLVDADNKPIGNTSYVLSIGNQKFEGQTNTSGEIHEQRVDPSGQHRGLLQLPDMALHFVVGVGDMNPAKQTDQKDHPRYDDGISGLLMRLRNLGYGPEDVAQEIHKEDGLSPEAQDAILTFQQVKMGLSGNRLTGKLDPATRNAITDMYGH